MSVAEYLHTSFPDRDKEYREGDLVERSLPTYLHGRTQGGKAVFPTVETRVKLRTGIWSRWTALRSPSSRWKSFRATFSSSSFRRLK